MKNEIVKIRITEFKIEIELEMQIVISIGNLDLNCKRNSKWKLN